MRDVLRRDDVGRGALAVIAGEGAEVEQLTGFDEGPMPADWSGEFERRGIRVSVGVGHDDALEVFRAFGASDAVVYNARGATGS